MKPVLVVPVDVNGQGRLKYVWQKSIGNLVAVTGVNKVVSIYDRHGDFKSQFTLPGLCTCLDWDKDGELLAATQDKSGILYLWSAHSLDVSPLDLGVKDSMTVCLWSLNTQLLALGTLKGNLHIYNHRTRRKIQILGKHTKRILCGAWSKENLLALGSEDRTITISNAEGDTIQAVSLRGEPSHLQFSSPSGAGGGSQQTIVSGVILHKTLYIYDIDNSDNPIELAFQGRYGDIVTYRWFDATKIVIGFSNGYFVVISTNKDDIGQERFQVRNHKDHLSDLTICHNVNQLATCGDNSVKIHDLIELKDVYNIINVDEGYGKLDQLQWTNDGQILSITTVDGTLLSYLTKLPVLGDANGTRLAYLTSLLEITIVNNVEEEVPMKFEVQCEPSFLALGPYHFAVGMNDRSWIYSVGDETQEMERSFHGSISGFSLNAEYFACMFEGKIQLMQIEPQSSSNLSTDLQQEEMTDQESRMFPDDGKTDIITCCKLTQDFLIFATEAGSLHYFFIEDWQYVNEFRHVVGIQHLYPNFNGTQLVFIDEKSDAYMYNPVNDVLLEIPMFPADAKGVIWENWPLDKHVFLTYNEDKMYTYVFYRDTIEGPSCVFAGNTKLPYGQKPLMLYNGEVSCQTLSGKIAIVRLSTHNHQDDQDLEEAELQASLQKCIVLKRFKDAWSLAVAIDKVDSWEQLASAALHHIDVDLAIRVYRQIKNIAMVSSLQDIKGLENRNLLAGYIAMFTNNYSLAQDLFLASSKPEAALQMCRDLLQWDQALELAKTLASDQLPFISREYAQQLEFTADYGNSLTHYERGLTNAAEHKAHDRLCNDGIARTALRTGDIRRGIGLAQSSSNKQLQKEAAGILETMKMFNDAGALYEKCEQWEKAASAYVKSKNWVKIGSIMAKVSNNKIHSQYAKAKEAEGSYLDAAKAYETAKDYENCIRVYFELLNNPDEAIRVAQDSQSVEGAKLVATHFMKIKDYSSAIRFIVVSKANHEAFTMAKAHNQMTLYADIIGADATKEDFLNIAGHFEETGNHLQAGKFFLKAENYEKALEHFIDSKSEDGEHIELAIDAVGMAKSEKFTQQLMEFLMGEHDGNAKDAKYLFRMYMSLEQYREAARIAVIIAREDQTSGNYRNAHDVLFNMYYELSQRKIKIPTEMSQNLMILHSYVIARVHIKQGNHLLGARLLCRVANNISKFPSHVVPILTSTVVECHRSGLKGSAFAYAIMLMRPEHRPKIDQKYAKKLEVIVRKQDKKEVEEELSPCPYCSHSLPLTRLDCPECKNTIPYCIATGQHMIRSDWCVCPSCKFPALHSEFTKLLNSMDTTCPMCRNKVDPESLNKLDNPNLHRVHDEE